MSIQQSKIRFFLLFFILTVIGAILLWGVISPIFLHGAKIIDKCMYQKGLFLQKKDNSPMDSMGDLLNAWLSVKDEKTGLFPDNTFEKRYIYSPSDSGADLFPFLYISSFYFNKTVFNDLNQTFEFQSTLWNKYNFKENNILESNSNYEMSEYLKDGMIPLLEFFQDEKIYNCSSNIVRKLNISDNPEIDGEILITISRLLLYEWNDELYEQGEEIFVHYINKIHISDDHLPVTYFADHGSEIIVGLVEFHNIRKNNPKEINTTLTLMFDSLISQLNDKFCWTKDNSCIDTSMYIYNAYYLFNKREAEYYILNYINNLDVNDYTSVDSLADVAEGILYILPYIENDLIEKQLNDFINTILNRQRKSGFYTRWHADGNVMRTLIMYSIYKNILEYNNSDIADYPRINSFPKQK